MFKEFLEQKTEDEDNIENLEQCCGQIQYFGGINGVKTITKILSKTI